MSEYVWYNGIRWGLQEAAQVAKIPIKKIWAYYEVYGKNAVYEIEKGTPIKGYEQKKFPLLNTDHMYLKNLSERTGIHVETLRYRFKKGLRGEQLISKDRINKVNY